MNRFVLKNILNKYFYRNNKLKLCFGDRIAVKNDFIY